MRTEPDDFLAHGLLPAVILAFAEVQLVQWTAAAADPYLLIFDLMASGVLLVGAAAILAVAAHAVCRTLPPSRAVAPIFTALLVGVHLSRGRSAGMTLADPVLAVMLLLAVVSGVAILALQGKRHEVSAAAMTVLAGGNFLFWAAKGADPRAGSLGRAAALYAAVAVALLVMSVLFPPSPRRSPLAISAILGLACLVSYPLAPGWGHVETRRTGKPVQASGDAAEPLSVILVVLDTVRGDILARDETFAALMPNLYRFSRKGLRFPEAIANASWSLPSHASLLTGLLPHEHGAHSVVASVSADEAGSAIEATLAQRPLAHEHVSLAELLASRGYDTAAVVANHGWFSNHYGLAQGFSYIDRRPRNVLAVEPLCGPYVRKLGSDWLLGRYALLSGSTFTAGDTVAHVADALDAHSPVGDRPLFLLINFMDAHGPYLSGYLANAPELPRADAFDPEPNAVDGGGSAAEPSPRSARMRSSWRRYLGSLAYLDRQLGELFQELGRRELLDSGIVIVTSDHGEDFGENRSGHGTRLSQALIHIPLVVRLPEYLDLPPASGRAQLLDVFPTVLDVVGIPDPRPEIPDVPDGRRAALRGRSLLREGVGAPVLGQNHLAALRGTYRRDLRLPFDEIDARYPTSWAILEGRWKLVLRSTGDRELRDLHEDLRAGRDVAAEHPAIAATLERRLRQLLPPSALEDYLLPSSVDEVDADTLEQLRSLGYVE